MVCANVKNLSEAKSIASFFDEVLVLADHPTPQISPKNVSLGLSASIKP